LGNGKIVRVADGGGAYMVEGADGVAWYSVGFGWRQHMVSLLHAWLEERVCTC
jgi:hypothetical protein